MLSLNTPKLVLEMCINLLDLTPVQKENNPIVKNYTCILNPNDFSYGIPVM